ncbi:hypothetical protein SAMN04488522_104501 [Pedobacter caeni]|uniref:Uncharacterized protein n=2 Tax=Pedobacter caeni TaxID=288992 RepID=A0A1M5H432_9SPHI|nr:hypothetical protein SAMN04488522_104501 [Pedobacter caeni]
MGRQMPNCPHGFNDQVMKHLTTLTRPSSKNILRYKYERIQIIGPACGGRFNSGDENPYTSTFFQFGSVILTIKKLGWAQMSTNSL